MNMDDWKNRINQIENMLGMNIKPPSTTKEMAIAMNPGERKTWMEQYFNYRPDRVRPHPIVASEVSENWTTEQRLEWLKLAGYYLKRKYKPKIKEEVE
jgi:hypothetical protein